jgi:hypothetical protein
MNLSTRQVRDIRPTGAKWNNFGILRSLRRYRPNQDLRIAPLYRITSASSPIPDVGHIGAERIGSD